MLRFAASHLGLFCLPMSHKKDVRLIWVNVWLFLPDCGDPSIANSILIGTTVFDGAAFINCNAGYTGSGSAECLNIGIWNPATLPTCTPKGKLVFFCVFLFSFNNVWVFSPS